MKITKLTPEQEAARPAYRDKWIKIGLNTNPANRDQAEAGIRAAYELADLEWHNNVVWSPSPLVTAIASPIAAVLLTRQATDPKTVDAVIDRKLSGMFATATEQETVADQIRVVIDTVTSGRLGPSRNTPPSESDLLEAIRSLWWRYRGGAWWVSWTAWRAYFVDVCGLELPAQAAKALQSRRDSAAAGWWWPHTDFTVVTDNPSVIHRLRLGPDGWGSHCLHSETGPAIAWDGWGLYFWRGLNVPAWVIEDPTVARIAKEQNIEVRRAGVESLGWDRFVVEAGLVLVAEAPDPGHPDPSATIRLYDVDSTFWGDQIRLALVTNGSPERDGTVRSYGLEVPVSHSDPVEAVAETYGLSADEYRLLERRT